MPKRLVVYFSRPGENYFSGKIRNIEEGNTKVAARMMKDLLDADWFELEMETPYSTGYAKATEEAKADLKKGILPGLKALPENLELYDTIILGYPNYWGTYPMAVKRFLKSCDLKGKTILPFVTHEGSGLGHSMEDLKADLPDSKVLPGLAIPGSAVKKSAPKMEEWLKNSL